MIAKVVGMCDGYYKERVWSDVIDYIFTNSCDAMAEIVFTGNVDAPYSHVELLFDEDESVCVSFSDRVYIMENNGRTVDLLKYDANKENRYR